MRGGGDMSENHGVIKLFGFKIPLPQPQIPDVCRQVERLCPQNSVQQENSSDSTARKPNHQENEPKQDPETVEDKIKIFKKPDKIIQCPRCNSTETKFCYFNNHNANQPRHFCKKCQRYWTAGGLLRNVPVGSGKRKKKQVASLFHHPTVTSDEISTPTLQTIYSSGYQFLSNPDETSAFYWSSKDHCILLKYMHTVLNLSDQKTSAEGSSINRVSKELSPSNPVPPWLFPWNPDLKYVVSMCNPNSNFYTPTQSYDPTPLVAFPGSCPPSIPSQLASSSHWGGTLARAAGTESVSIGSNGCLWRSSSTSNCCCSGDASQTLGKHFRNTLFTDEDKSSKCILVPKTLRIDDPNEAHIRYQG